MINHLCTCGAIYRHCAEIVQAGGSVMLKEWQMIFKCKCGEEIQEAKLWEQHADVQVLR
jgi:hypothetical protein